MAKSKNNNALYICIGVAVVVVIAIIVGVIIGNNNKGGQPASGEPGASQTTGTTPDYSTVDELIEFGDYNGMETLSKEIQNGYATGKVVTIEGLVSHPMSTYSVVQASEDGTKKIGTQFIIEGAEDADYPEDGARIVITGEVFEKEPMYFVIKTTPEYIETIEVTE